MSTYSKVTFVTRDGSRYVESISLDGHPTFRVTDPRHIFQPQFSSGYVRIITRRLEDGTVVFADSTVRGLRRYGVELADLVPAGEESGRAA